MNIKSNLSKLIPIMGVLFSFCAFRVLDLGLPLLLYENGGGLSALPLCVEALMRPDIYNCILFAALALLRIKTPDTKLMGWEKLFCCALVLCLLVGDSYAAINSWDVVFGSAASILLSAMTFVGAADLAMCLLRWAKPLVSGLFAKKVQLPKLWQRHPFLIPWAIIVICWLPYFIMRLPAAVEHDAYMQLEMVFGLRELTAHNPLFSTLLIGFWVKLGTALFGAKEAGLTLFVIFQMLVCSAILAYTALTMRRLKAPNVMVLIAVALYALTTIYPNYLTTIIKDALYACMTLFLLALVAEELLLPHSAKRCIGIFFAALLTGLLRNNGFLLVLAFLISAVICLSPGSTLRRPMMTAALLAAFLLQTLYSSALIPALGIPKGPFYESLSVPFQQTARYVRDYPQDVTAEEREIIDALLDYDTLAERYDPNLSDPVKNRCTMDESAVGPYFKVWLKQLLRHPAVYLEATLNNAYGFFHPNSREYIFWYTTISTNEDLAFREIGSLYPLKIAARYLVMLFETFPVTLPLCNTGCHVWLAIYLLLRAKHRKDHALQALSASIIMSMIVCLACPVFFINGIRYALPIIYATPLLTAVTLRSTEG